ncbi:FapA family protein [Alkaliphilus oremlandii]|uniref:RNA-binding protein KhpB N-terminal domain-containing protein n=1 Tax=Alkaliphilus oremlandii (strain OhILAs) TaxID=350688 RepID=A8MHG7_ALKOO|nr:FapA family protein [Alkaliphilus oremlandii]ABW19054.1 protein of unknown function DUF342 [Alkaliphilus oremlandii OhILAs]
MTIYNNYIIAEGESYDAALKYGLEQLNLKQEQVQIEVLEEKKSFLFKRGFIKLKITPIQSDSLGEPKSNIGDPVVKRNNFALNYLPDGVYLNIIDNSQIDIKDIIDFLILKKVTNYEYDKIALCVEGKKIGMEKIAPYQEENFIDSMLEIRVSDDKLEASILLSEPLGGKYLSVDEIIEGLTQKGITYGIDEEKIHEICTHHIFNKWITIAQGKKAVHGKNASVIYLFEEEKESTTSVITDEGRIDYKNLNNIRNVNEGSLLLEIIPATEGTNGMTVYGKEIPSSKGKDIAIKKGKNIYESEDGLKIFASKDGEVHFVDGRIYVDEVKNIDGNIDNETGNIQFNGKVNIKGNVKSGFKVEAEGDIEIFGVVESAHLISNGNIIIHRGVQGNNQAYIYCKGSLHVKYLENANVVSGEDITADAILHSNVTTKGKVVVQGKKGLIAGGDIKAGKEVRANIIGSHMGTLTKIEVGINPDEKSRFESLKSEFMEIEKNMENSQKAVELLQKMARKQELNSGKQELLVKSLKTYNVLKTKYSDMAKELTEMSERFKESNNGKVHAAKVVYQGVKIIIGNVSRQIYDELATCTFYIKDGEVTFGPYEK